MTDDEGGLYAVDEGVFLELLAVEIVEELDLGHAIEFVPEACANEFEVTPELTARNWIGEGDST